jgi:hypothetical protein
MSNDNYAMAHVIGSALRGSREVPDCRIVGAGVQDCRRLDREAFIAPKPAENPRRTAVLPQIPVL